MTIGVSNSNLLMRNGNCYDGFMQNKPVKGSNSLSTNFQNSIFVNNYINKPLNTGLNLNKTASLLNANLPKDGNVSMLPSKPQAIVNAFISLCTNSLKSGLSKLSQKAENLKQNVKSNANPFLITQGALELAQESKSSSIVSFNTYNEGLLKTVEFSDGTIWQNIGRLTKTISANSASENKEQTLKDTKQNNNTPACFPTTTQHKIDYVKYKIQNSGGKKETGIYKYQNKNNSVILSENSIIFNGITYKLENGKYIHGTNVLNLEDLNKSIK